MRRHLATILLIGCAASAAAAVDLPTLGYPDLEAVSPASASERMARPFDDGDEIQLELRGGGKRTVRSCSEYLALPGNPSDHWAGPGPDQRVYCAVGSHCFALRALAEARPSKWTFIGRSLAAIASDDILPAGLGLVLSTDDEERLKRLP
jgi:hypothetical protein